MSQRRNANSKPPTETTVVKGSLSLETPSPSEEKVPLSTGTSDLSGGEGPSPRFKIWKESPFAVGLTEPTWEAERLSMSGKRKDRDDEDNDNQPIMYDEDYLQKDTTGCLCCSAVVCSYLGAGRVGNMVVLNASTEWVEEVEQDEETGEEKVTRYTRPKLNWVVGPL